MKRLSLTSVVLAALLAAAPLFAQSPAAVTARGGYQSSLLTKGDLHGDTYEVGLDYPVSMRLFVVASGHYTNASQTDFRTVVRSNLLGWQDLKTWAGDVGARYTAFYLPGPVVTHRFGVSGGVSYRYREEELARSHYFPGAVEREGFVENEKEHLRGNQQLYTFGYYDGPGGAPDGRHAIVTDADSGWDLGGFLGLHYTAELDRLAPGMSVGYRTYTEGAQVWSLGLHLGLRL